MAEAGLTVAEARRRGQGSAHIDADLTQARWIARRISPLEGRAICRFSEASAEATMVLSIASEIGGGALAARRGPSSGVAVLVLLQMAHLLDVVDGAVARLRNRPSHGGRYLDWLSQKFLGALLFLSGAMHVVCLAPSRDMALQAAEAPSALERMGRLIAWVVGSLGHVFVAIRRNDRVLAALDRLHGPELPWSAGAALHDAGEAPKG